MERMYDGYGNLLAWRGHRDSGWEQGGPSKRQRRTVDGHSAGLLQELRRLVLEARETVNSLTESFAPLKWDRPNIVISEEELARARNQHQLIIQEERIHGAKSHEEWAKAAEALDGLDGSELWRTIEESEDYDVETLKAKLAELESARDNEDLARMLRLIRHSLGRNVAGINDPVLFQRSRIGTKALVEQYVATAVDTIESAMRLVKHCKSDTIPRHVIKQDLLNARQSYGRTALLLSGGGTLGMVHIGVCKALFEADLLPRVVSGTSAGSIVASVLCTRTDDEIPKLLAEFCDGDLRVFGKTPEDLSFWGRGRRFCRGEGFLAIRHLEDGMRPHLGDMTFLEAYNRTHRILTIALSNANSLGEVPLLCCFSTTPNVLIRSAVAASCSVPIVYPTATLLEKNPSTGEITEYGTGGQKFMDGSVAHDLPLDRLKEMLDVNHFIVSQVNPHIVPFLSAEPELYGNAELPEPTWFNTAWNFGRRTVEQELKHRYYQVQDSLTDSSSPTGQRLGKLMFYGSSIVAQKYTGDITIFPEIKYPWDMAKVLANPTPEFMRESMRRGQVAAWPFLDRIRARTAIERAIDKSVTHSLERVFCSPSQVDLRHDRLSQPSAAARLRGRRHSLRDRPRSMVLPPEQPDLLAALHRPTRSLHEASDIKLDLELELPDLANSSTSPPLSDSDDWAPRFRSVPASPSLASKTFPFGPPSPSAPSSLFMTPTPGSSSKPSAPEQRYKRLFHSVKNLPIVRSRNHSRSGRSGAASPDLLRSGAASPELLVMKSARKIAPSPELSRTGRASPELAREGRGTLEAPLALRGVGKQRRSTSTGLKGLRPPGRQ